MKNIIVNVPLEPFEQRYTNDWRLWFEKYMKPEITIDGTVLTAKIESGSFLDVCGTNYFKASQLQGIVQYIYVAQKSSDMKDVVFFFHDLWWPGLESLAYIRDGLGLKFKIMGCLHAGSYDSFDFLAKQGMGYWAKEIENSWFKIIDKIFVATNFHKRLIMEKRKVDPKKIIVTGFPIYYNGKHLPKENIVVFPHRLDSEKNPHLFTETEIHFRMKGTDWKFISTKNVCGTKQEYWNILERSKISVSFADQETWGIAMQESLFADCIPLVPNRLSYAEMYDPAFLYDGLGNFLDKLKGYMEQGYPNPFEVQKDRLLSQGACAIPNMLKEINR